MNPVNEETKLSEGKTPDSYQSCSGGDVEAPDGGLITHEHTKKLHSASLKAHMRGVTDAWPQADTQDDHSKALKEHIAKKEHTEVIDYDHDVMLYKNDVLTTWKAFNIGKTSVWRSHELWSMMLKLGIVAVVVAILTILLLKDPAALKVGKFTDISKFLNVVIGLMMGFFLSSSTKRWHRSVHGFLELLDAIRNLQMQFKALGVPRERSLVINRHGLASAWLLYGDLLTQWQRFTKSPGNLLDEMWERIETLHVNLDGHNSTRLIDDDEIKMLRKMRDPAGIMWMWIANQIGALAQDELIPPMQSPTYGRIMNLCQAGHGGIRMVRAAIVVQAPLPYTHTLAILVHINNFLNAITFGLVCGCGSGTILSRFTYGDIYGRSAKPTDEETKQDLQMIGVTFLYCFFGPLLYQALLIIGFHLAQPFDHEDTTVPLDVLLHRLEVDLMNGNQLMDRIPGFEKPSYKTPKKT